MDNKFKPDAKKPKEQHPNTQDIISVDGRWGQVMDDNHGAESPNVIVWLDGREPAHGFIYLSEYDLAEKFNSVIVRDIENQFSSKEIEKIFWDKDVQQGRNTYLKTHVSVFGRYVKKPV